MYQYELVLNEMSKFGEEGCKVSDIKRELNITRKAFNNSVFRIRQIGFIVKKVSGFNGGDARYVLVRNEQLMQRVEDEIAARKEHERLKYAKSDEITEILVKKVIHMIKKSGHNGISSKTIKEVFNLHKKNQIKILIQNIKRRGVNIINISETTKIGVYVIKNTFSKTESKSKGKVSASKNRYFMCQYEKITSHYRFKPPQNAIIESVFR